MTSTDADGTPVLILQLSDVKILYRLLDMPETPDQDKVVNQIIDFLNEPACLDWERKNA